ncbi:MAG: O-antigen ligase family protein [Clostridia bacterium]|nr:O-antigen ligase family protein [Clostridia bacterium]
MDGSKVFDKIEKFCSGDLFIVAAAAVVFIGWVTGLWVIFLCLLALLCTAPLFFTSSNRSLLVFFMQFTFIISHNSHDLASYWWLLLLLIPLFGGLIFQGVRFRKEYRWDILRPSKFKGQHFFLLLLMIPFALGGIVRGHEKPLVIFLAFLIIFMVGAAYTYYMVSNYGREDKAEMPSFVLKNLVAVGIIISLQMIVYYLKLGSVEAIVDAIAKKRHALGWGGPNNIGTIYTLAIPATLYFCTKDWNRTPLFVVAAIAEYALLVSTGSRGSILVVTVAMPAMLLYIMAVTPHKRAYGFSLCAVIFAAMVGIVLTADKIIPALADRFAMGLDSNGRMDFEYPAAWEAFRNHPIFGVGWDYMMGERVKDGYTPLWFHSTILQVGAVMGVVGLLFHGVWTFQRYRSFFLNRKDTRVQFLFVSTLLFEGYCMVDTGFFSPSFFAMMIIIQFAVEVTLEEDEGLALPRRLFEPKGDD